MKKKSIVLFVFALCMVTAAVAQRKITNEDSLQLLRQQIDTRVDNMKYWNGLVKKGILEPNAKKFIPAADFTGSKLAKNTLIVTEDSPDVPTTTESSTQSENSIFVSPVDNDQVLNSNNSTNLSASTLWGANYFTTMNGGETWGGSVEGAGGDNSGDPTTCISLDNRWYVNFIHSNYGQGVAYSTNNGATWTPQLIAPSPGGSGMLDKNHMWIDNSPSSPYVGNLYVAWTNFGGTNDTEIEIARTANGGVAWATPINISSAINAGSHNQGVNIQTGPAGQVYAVWTIYDSWPSDEAAMGFAKSTNGGVSYAPATRIISNIRGIRTSGTPKDHRVNSFPSVAVDISGGSYNGNIYVVWTNIGVPQTNTGTNISVYMIKSSDEGSTWSAPIRINQDPFTSGKTHYLPWITCDPVSGTLSCIFYDDRNTTTTKDEVWVANSFDGGATWEDMKISDVAFEPHPIAGLAASYMGDYLGISAYDRKVYPIWTDNRSGHCLSYTSPYETGPIPGQAFIIYNSVVINDDVMGNNNGALETGEIANLSFALKNIGDMPANAVTATLSTESSYITLLDNTEFFGNFTNPDTVTILNAFTLQIANNIPDQTKAKFVISATDGDSTWVSNFTLMISAPKLEIGDIVVSDPLPLGNNNSLLEPGETVVLKIANKNLGNFEAMNTVCNVHTTSPYLHIANNSFTIDLLPKHSTVPAEFTVTLDSAATLGSFIDLIYDATSGMYSASEILYQPVGNVSLNENFESGSFASLNWQFAGSPIWRVIPNGGHSQQRCAKSGAIAHNGSTSIYTNMYVFADDSITFWKKTSTQSNGDYLKFYIDGIKIGEWSGSISWSKEQFFVHQGNHVFKWEYKKNGSGSTTDDCVWLDDIQFPLGVNQTTALSVTAAAYDSTLCTGENTQLYAVSIGGGSNHTYSWTPTTGLSNPTIANPIANPETSTTYTVSVTSGTQTANTTLNVLVKDYPVISLGNDTNICVGTTYALTPGLEFGMYFWNDSSTESSLNVDTVGTYAVIVMDTYGCISNVDSINIGLKPLPVANIDQNGMVCNGGTAIVDAGSGFAGYIWSDNSTNQTLTVSEAGVYSVKVIDNLGCISLPDTITFGQYPKPEISLGKDTTMKIYGEPLVIHAGDYISYLWSDGTTGSSLVLAPEVFTVESKNYSVIVTDQNGCTNSDTIKVTFINNIGVDGISAKMESIEALPNPSTGKFNLSINGLRGSKAEISILNIHGQNVYNETIDISGAVSVNKAIDISSKPKGMYVMSVRNGNLVKIIKIQLQ